MADRIVNNGIEFAYTSEHIEIELKKELEKYFLYQTVLIVDKYFEFGEVTKKLERNIKCNFVCVKDIDDCDNIENISCVLVVNCHNIDEIKMVCFENSIPYIIALTKLCDSMCLKEYAYIDSNMKKCNLPIGIVLSQNYIFDQKQFISQAILEISSLSFDILQKKIDNLFFGENIDYKDLSVEKKLLTNLQFIVNDRRENTQEFVKKISVLYLSYGLLASRNKPSLLDNLLYLYKLNNKSYLIETKYVFSLIVTSLEKNFFSYYTAGFISPINIELHQKYLLDANLKPSFKSLNMPNEKINFLLGEFREKLIEYVKFQIAFDNFIKNSIADIDVDFLYKIFAKTKDLSLTNYINIEPDIFKNSNFLSLLYGVGLLNFDF